jgi:uncharacterized protein (TIGR02246 family)
MPMATPKPSHAGAEGAARNVARQLEDAWNRHDMAAFANLFSENAVFATIGGTTLDGRAQIEKHHAMIHSSHYRDSVFKTMDVSVRFVRPDVCIMHILNEAAFDRGTQTVRTLMLLVMTQESGTWTIAAAHNTLAGPPPAALIERWKAAAGSR